MIVESGAAPEFTLPADDGSEVSLASLKGAPAVLYFYPKDDTSGCTLEAQDFTALIGKFRALGARVIGISPDSVKSHCKFRDKFELAVTLASDEDKAVCQAYGVWAEKQMYGKTYMGVERTTVLIDAKSKIRRIWHKVKVPGHAAEVLSAVEALAAGRKV